MPISQKKIEELSQFYLKNGFDHSTDEIVEGLNISRKTFFNRYKSKENSVKMAVDFWYDHIQHRFQEKIVLCNHAVEELLQFGYELHYVRTTERHFFHYLIDHNLFASKDSPFVIILANIIRKGIQHYQFKEDVNENLYARYAMNNIAHYIYQDGEKEEIVRYILSPIVTNRTMALLKELDFDSI